ncbi:MAG: hypothetical protein RL376_1050 [Verrucomicrobiota bacterium]|jgi:heavy metal sensor kinase
MEKAKQRSFRVRLALLVGATVGGLTLLFAVLLWEVTVRGHRERIDRELADTALSSLLREHGPNHFRRFAESLALTTGDGPAEFVLLVRDEKGGLVYRSENWPAELAGDGILPSAGELGRRPPEDENRRTRGPEGPLLAQREFRFGTVKTSGGEWRVVAAGNEKRRLWLGVETRGFVDELNAEKRAFIGLAAVALAASALASWWLAGRALRPVRDLARRLELIDARDLGTRLDEAGQDREFVVLAQVFNRLLSRLETSFRQASRFGADAAHELRTPLALLHTQLEDALHRAQAGSEHQEDVAALLGEVARLRDITDKLLLLAQADSGRLALRRETVDLSALCLDLAEDLRLLGPERRLTVAIAPGVKVGGDRVLLERVLQNLAANAVRYSSGEDRVELSLEPGENEVRLRLSNEGAEIAEEEEARIFERFYRGDEARSRETGGAGLGLALAREIARAHGGELALSSRKPTCFTLTLPK